MKTKNFQIYKGIFLCGKMSPTGNTTYLASTNFIATDGTSFNDLYTSLYSDSTPMTCLKLSVVDNTYSYNNIPTSAETRNYMDLWVGSDGSENTVIDENDYCENNAIVPIASTDITRTSITATPTTDGLKYYVTITAQFTALTDITVREVGLSKFCTVNSSRTKKAVLFARIVLPDEEVYHANDTFTKTVVIEIS